MYRQKHGIEQKCHEQDNKFEGVIVIIFALL